MSRPLTHPADRVPPLPANRAVLLCVVATAAVLGGAEAFWRIRGLEPNFADSADLWVAQRRRLDGPTGPDGAPARPVALAGSSRAEWAVDPETFGRLRPGRTLVDLAIAGDEATPVLADLAADPAFRGTVLAGFMDEPPDPRNARRGEQFTAEAARPAAVGERWAAGLAVAADGVAVLRTSEVSWERRLADLVKGRPWPREPAWVRSADRHIRPLAGRSSDLPRPIDPWRDVPGGAWGPTAWRERAERQLRSARTIARRGGKVIFVRFPSSGRLRRRVADHYPKAEFWDRFAAAAEQIPGVFAVHFEDVPALRQFDCPDESHLTLADRPAFTEALLAELGRRGAL